MEFLTTRSSCPASSSFSSHTQLHGSTDPSAPLSVLSTRLLLCLSVWPYRSQQLQPHTRIQTPPQCLADTFSSSSAQHTHTSTTPTSSVCWNEWCVWKHVTPQCCAPVIGWPLPPPKCPLIQEVNAVSTCKLHTLPTLHTHLLSCITATSLLCHLSTNKALSSEISWQPDSQKLAMIPL